MNLIGGNVSGCFIARRYQLFMTAVRSTFIELLPSKDFDRNIATDEHANADFSVMETGRHCAKYPVKIFDAVDRCSLNFTSTKNAGRSLSTISYCPWDDYCICLLY